MGALVTQLLDLARMENVAPQMETVDFSHLVSGETLPFESVMYEKGMVFNCDIQDKILVHGNSMQLKQITAILLDNAVKHSTAGGEILLSLKKDHGLAIARAIAVGHHGKIEVKCYGGKVQFTISLPAEK
ncbi:MAG: hypothetical protein MR936_00845 [Eubacterium sp.]|nr:hypothetical protein [Eubacterium sp.]